jgi:hypothetical protein
MLKEFFTKNIGFKVVALALAIVLWNLAKYWLPK